MAVELVYKRKSKKVMQENSRSLYDGPTLTLVIDDDVMNVEVMTAMLELFG